MHVMTTWNIPKIGKMNLSSPKKMIAHMEKLGIEKAVLMSSGEKKIPFGKNSVCQKICKAYPDHFAWMCMLDHENPDTVYDRLAEYKKQGAIGVGELTINKRLDDPFLQKVFEAAEKLNLPLTIHMSPEEGYKYGIVDFNELSPIPEVDYFFKRGNNQIPIYKLHRIAGTVLAKNDTRCSVMLLTTTGVVSVKFSRDYYAMFKIGYTYPLILYRKIGCLSTQNFVKFSLLFRVNR